MQDTANDASMRGEGRGGEGLTLLTSYKVAHATNTNSSTAAYFNIACNSFWHAVVTSVPFLLLSRCLVLIIAACFGATFLCDVR